MVPCYNEQEALPLFKREADRIATILHDENELAVEFVFVDDGSADATLDELRTMHAADSRVRYVSFSRNFGKEAALYAGLEAAKGDLVATLDADLQDPPSLLLGMVRFLASKPDFDQVATRRETRQGEPAVRSLFARIFYRLINQVSGTKIVDSALDYRLMTRRFVNAVLTLSERNRFSKGIFSWVGFKTHWIAYSNIERVAGKTHWSFFELLRYAVEGVVGFSTTPLIVASFLGMLCCLLAFAGIILVIVRATAFGDPVAGWPSMICVILLIGGLQLFCLGILGEYLAKAYLETKHRPIYVKKEDETAYPPTAIRKAEK